MLKFPILALLGWLVAVTTAQKTGKLGDARPVTNNALGDVWLSTFTGAIKGTIKAESNKVGVNFTVSLTGLAVEKGPYLYHIRHDPVPSDGNCSGTGIRLDPFQRGDSPACNSTAPATCQVGDLSGKYGALPGPSANVSFNDPYAATNIIDLQYIGNRAIVIEDASSAKIACANITKAAAA